jgi:hypothetical protein
VSGSSAYVPSCPKLNLGASRILHDYVMLLCCGRMLKSGCVLKCKSATACWDRAFKSHQGHGSSSLVSVVCCQVDICDRPITCSEES